MPESNVGISILRQCGSVVALTLLLLLTVQVSFAQQDNCGGNGCPDLSHVDDVTNGMRYLLLDDDLATLQVNSVNGQFITSVVTQDTQNSNFSGSPETVNITQVTPQGWNTNGTPVAEASGRMYETKTDVMAVLSEGSGPTWEFNLFDLANNYSSTTQLQTSFRPHGTVYTQVAMGKFTGSNGLDDPLVLYTSYDSNQQVQWGMKVLAPQDPKQEGPPRQGPEASGSVEPVPFTGSLVTGNFAGDARYDQFAFMLTDYDTIQFYRVVPKSLVIDPQPIAQLRLSDFSCGQFRCGPFKPGLAALAAGKFRNTTNSELVAFGQLASNPGGYTLESIQITPDGQGGFTPTVVQSYQFPLRNYAMGALAQAASIVNFAQQTNQQLLLGTPAHGQGASSWIDIGSFDQNFNFTLQSSTELVFQQPLITLYELLQSMKVGNFDHLCGGNDCKPAGAHNPNLQLETLASLADGNAHLLQLWDIKPDPSSNDWLVPGAYQASTGTPTPVDAVPADLQGRSARLGYPEIVSIPQIQPDIVLGMPPMHVDWIAPTVNYLPANKFPGCQQANVPCVLNLTVKPLVPAPGLGFDTEFNFMSGQSTAAKRSATTSWGISVKQTTEAKLSWGDKLTGASLDVKNSVAYAHDQNVAQTYDNFSGLSESVSATTGFDDHLFFTVKRLNTYYYPVLGTTWCPQQSQDGNNCPDPKPAYVEFSVPDDVSYADADAAQEEWYQPVHEPGEALSYPWSPSQLNSQFVNPGKPLISDRPCRLTDTSRTSYSENWNGSNQTMQSVGSSDTFSDDVSISVGARTGIEDVSSGKLSFNLDFGVNRSWSSLNEGTNAISASLGIVENKPSFNGFIVQCCEYGFENYTFGQSSDSLQMLKLNDPQGNPVQIDSTGPLFVNYLADVVPGTPGGLDCGTGGGNFWPAAYNLPDVAVNHPARWAWSQSEQSVSFFPPGSDPLEDPFYQMKGFFITEATTNQNSHSPNLSSATAGDDLSLTARVYNYSLADTDAGFLQHPAKRIIVRFYGQYFCSSGEYSETSCQLPRHMTCEENSLCGDSFEIGEVNNIAHIAGFKSPNYPQESNWTTATVDFNTGDSRYPNLAGAHLVFWVVVWMEDATGALVPEIPDHGLWSNPGSNLRQITDVPVQSYSNNVGMYPVYAPFFLYPANQLQSSGTGTLQQVSLSSWDRTLLETRTDMLARLRAMGGPLENVNVAFFDGDPKKNGHLISVQKISHMEPDRNYTQRAVFTPTTCGVHQLYVWAYQPNSPGLLANFNTGVVIMPVLKVQALINSTEAADFVNPIFRGQVIQYLAEALQDLQNDQAAAARAQIQNYINALTTGLGKEIGQEDGTTLIGQAGTLLQCVPGGSVQPKGE